MRLALFLVSGIQSRKDRAYGLPDGFQATLVLALELVQDN